jgi:hypothetical protein
LEGALQMNPFGIIIALVLAISPVWIASDLIRRRSGLFRFYTKSELFFNRRIVAIPCILLVLLNWFWNIHKGL